MRRRKRPDYSLRVLKYRAYPRVLPQKMWDIAKAQRALWNQLVTLTNRHSEWARWLGNKTQGWAGFDATARGLVAASNLDWVNGPTTLNRLRTAMTRAGKHRGGWPHLHRGLERVALSHRFTNGGIALDKVVDNRRANRFVLQSSASWELPRAKHSPKQQHWRGRFQVGDETIDFGLALHRELPADAVLKQATWVGERAGQRWFWYIALTVEESPIHFLHSETANLTAGLDLGWRVFADGGPHDYLRVGMLADSEGRIIEFRLPLLLRSGPGGERRTIHYLDELKSLADHQLNAGKELAGDKRLGARGLRELAEQDHPQTEGIRAALAAHDLLRRRINEQSYHKIQRRRWWYQNLAQWLTQRYARIVLEADMSMAQLFIRSDDPALRAAAVYRNYAAVGELRRYLRLAAGQNAITLDGETAGSTTVCWQCGEKAAPGASLKLECPNGHRWDQDKNAALNLLSQIDGSFGQTHDWGSFRGRWIPLDIPAEIRAVAIEVPPG